MEILITSKGEFFGEIIEKHKLELDPLHPKDFIDVYLLEAEQNEEVISNQPGQPFWNLKQLSDVQHWRVEKLHLGFLERGNGNLFNDFEVGIALPHTSPGCSFQLDNVN